MQIAYMMGTSTSSALEAVYGEPKKKQNAETTAVKLGEGDTVSLSAKALELAARMQTADSEQSENEQDDEELLKQDNGSSGVDMGSGSGKQVSEIDSKINELQQKIVDVQNSAMPDESKQATIAGLQAQITALVQEKNAMEAQA